jgi:predicted nucleic acid-binding protein
MSLADACLVRMAETLTDPVILTTDSDFRVYRRRVIMGWEDFSPATS